MCDGPVAWTSASLLVATRRRAAQEWMEDELSRHAIQQRGSRIICRCARSASFLLRYTPNQHS